VLIKMRSKLFIVTSFVCLFMTIANSGVQAQVSSPQASPAPATPAPATPAPVDPFAYMEEVMGSRALDWVKAQNTVSTQLLTATTTYAADKAAVLSVLNNRDRIPDVSRRGNFFYNLLRDDQYKVGLWRRTTLDEYRKAKPQWEPILDLDALAKAENENWVWAGANCNVANHDQCLISLSRGGADARVTREFDLKTRQFVKDGFTLPEAKSRVVWVDANNLLVSTDFGANSLTKSGYPRIIKHWKRGTPLTQARTIYEGKVEDVSAFAYVERDPSYTRVYVGRSIDFYRSEQFLVDWAAFEKGADASSTALAQLTKIQIPEDAQLNPNGQWAFLEIKSDLKQKDKTFKSGSLLVSRYDALLAGKPEYQALFEPTPTSSLSDNGALDITKNAFLLTILENVTSRMEEWRFSNGQWTKRNIKTPTPGTLSAGALHDRFMQNDPLADAYVLTYTDFLTPNSVYLGKVGSDERELLKSNPVFFNSEGMRTEQRFAVSKDGTKVPYFVVYPKGYKAGGSAPTLLYGYGGFQVSMAPWYSGGWGRTWYERGGILVVANIRGGGEYGPTWHQSALLENKQRSYDDFIAVAQDLTKNGISRKEKLGIMGGSNGGLLVGAVMMQRPDLFGAVVCSVPLLDMRNYHKLLAGNSWMAEYGDPDKPEQWAFISKYSPYQNVKSDTKYPRVFFNTSTRDDRVHPGHARKMAALMMSHQRGPDQVLYYENIEGGHGGAANNEQRANLTALEMAFLWDTLGKN
jgi:prolyl oligopeptidase